MSRLQNQVKAMDQYTIKSKTAIREGEPAVVELTRATYKLPAGRAEELGAFLKSNLNDDVDVRVKDDALQVTATTGDQAAIAQFVRLLQTRSANQTKLTPKRTGVRIDVRPGAQPGGAESNNRSSDTGADIDAGERPRQEKPETALPGARPPENTPKAR